MDWSKKIGISILLVVLLTACSSRKNYGSVFFSRGDIYTDTTWNHNLSANDYMDFAISQEEFLEDKNHEANDGFKSMDSIQNKKELGATIESLDILDTIKTTPSDSTLVDVQEFSDSVIPDSLIFTDNIPDDYIVVDTVKLVKLDTAKTVLKDSTLPLTITKKDSIIRNPVTRKVTQSDSVEVEHVDLNEAIIEVKKPIVSDSLESIKSSSNQVGNSTLNDSLNSTEQVITTDSTVIVDSPVIVDKDSTDLILTESSESDVDTVGVEGVQGENDLSEAESSISETFTYSISFDSGDKELSEDSKRKLKALIIEANSKSYVLHLSGHTDKSGTEEYNQTLSEDRVKAVSEYLESNGLDKNNIHLESFGAKYATNNNDVNRRVVLCKLVIE